MASTRSSEQDDFSIDPSAPLKGIIVCCTSIPPEQRTELAQRVAELGGIHKYDLTPDVTHLIVGDYDTAKYRHVARERPDVKSMDATWIEAMTELWKADVEIDFRALEKEHQLRPLEMHGAQEVAGPSAAPAATAERGALLICLTGFGDLREAIAERITANGARYTGDLTRKCTHLIVNRPEGKKFVAAKSWNIRTVTLKWLDQSIERGMILDESLYDPALPEEEQGVGAWTKKESRRTSLGKRSRSAQSNGPEDGTRKLRKTASMKLNSQKNTLWSDILGRSDSRENSLPHNDPQAAQQEAESAEPNLHQRQHVETPPGGVFSNCIFFMHGFTPLRAQLLEQAITSMEGKVASSLAEAAASSLPHRFLIVPQTSQPDTHPHCPSDDIHIVTEFYIERCLHNKRFFHPADHVLGRPFPLFPIPGFSDLRVCGAAFTGIELNQVAKGVEQLGAVYEEKFQRTTSVLVCKSLQALRKDKLRYALEWGVPLVPADWLWECINTGYKVPVENFIFPEVKKRYSTTPAAQRSSAPATGAKSHAGAAKAKAAPVQRTRSDPVAKSRSGSGSGSTSTSTTASRPPASAGVDTTAFEKDDSDKASRAASRRPQTVKQHDSTTSADFMTARTSRIHDERDSNSTDSDSKALTELSSASLNKSPSPSKPSGRDRHHRSNIDDKTASRHSSAAPDAPSHDKAEATVEEAELLRKQRARAAERQALSSKITNLLQSTTPAAAAAAAAAGSDEESASLNIANNHTSGAVPRPRKRQVLGRASSNASSAADSMYRPPPTVGAATLPISAAGEDGSKVGQGRGDSNEEDAPPATQLEYRDPEAQEFRAAVMSRMEGGSAAATPTQLSTGTGAGAVVGASSVSVVGGRSLRRR